MSLHPAHHLFEKLSALAPYPPGVVAVPDQIQGTSFFPGGTGLWHRDEKFPPAFPVGGVMVLGHDFHSVAGYERSKRNMAENLRSPSWRHLLEFLARVPIDPVECFFTNIYMGLREGAATTGVFPGARSIEFVKRCQQFFLVQIAAQQPSLILTLGGYVPAFLASLSPQLVRWDLPRRFQDRDAADLALATDVEFLQCEAKPCTVVSLIHPSFRPRNVGHRQWRSHTGDAAELALTQEALRLTLSRQAGSA